MKLPIAGQIWIKYQVAQFSRILGTLLTGGIPLVQALETARQSVSSALLRQVAGTGHAGRARRQAAVGGPGPERLLPWHGH